MAVESSVSWTLIRVQFFYFNNTLQFVFVLAIIQRWQEGSQPEKHIDRFGHAARSSCFHLQSAEKLLQSVINRLCIAPVHKNASKTECRSSILLRILRHRGGCRFRISTRSKMRVTECCFYYQCHSFCYSIFRRTHLNSCKWYPLQESRIPY